MRNHSWKVWSVAFFASVIIAGPASAQPTGPGPVGPGPMGPGPMSLPSVSGVTSPMSLETPPMVIAFAQHYRQEREREVERAQRDRETRLYDQGRDDLDNARYDRAIQRFTDAAAMKGTHADAALYFKAWAQNKVGSRAEALATLAALTKDYPKSRYLTQAKALDAEVRRSSGQPAQPEKESDDDLKIYALSALMNSDPDKAVPMIEQLLGGTASPRVKSKALFVLAQSDSPRARDMIKKVAMGTSSPDLQNRAIDYLGTQGGKESRAVLAEIYGSTTDVDVKRRILRAFMVAGERDRLLTAAQSEQNADLRAEAVQQLGVMGAHDALWQLYQKETAVDVKKRIIQAMFVGGDADRLIDLAKSEKDPELRRTAIRNLGIMGSKKTADALAQIYATDKDPEVRRSVINGLFVQGNATALVDLARKESDPAMKREIVSKLALMGSKDPAVTQYMLEVLNGK